jgi:hypothetical protein
MEALDGGLCRFFFSALCWGGGVRHELSLVDVSTGLSCMLRHAITAELGGGRLAWGLHLPGLAGGYKVRGATGAHSLGWYAEGGTHTCWG